MYVGNIISADIFIKHFFNTVRVRVIGIIVYIENVGYDDHIKILDFETNKIYESYLHEINNFEIISCIY